MLQRAGLFVALTGGPGLAYILVHGLTGQLNAWVQLIVWSSAFALCAVVVEGEALGRWRRPLEWGLGALVLLGLILTSIMPVY